MKARTIATAAFVSLAAVTISSAAQPVYNVPLFWSFGRDFDQGHPWTSADVVEMLQQHPDTYLFVGDPSPYPLGSPVLTSLGHRVDEWQDAIRSYNRTHDPGLDLGHICIEWRPDLVQKHIDGTGGEKNCGSLLDAPQCAPSPCSEHPDNPCTRWEGTMGSQWGPLGRFDPHWLLTVPSKTWDEVVRRYYGGQDFCTGDGHRWAMADRRTICRANSSDRKVVLYGQVNRRDRRLWGVSGVALDLRNTEAREWNARRLLSRLSNLGIDPGEPGCVLIGYKPGMWAPSEATLNIRPCPGYGAQSPYGYATTENSARCAGPLLPSPYGPGEFKRAMNEQMRTVFRLLDQPAPSAMQKTPGGHATYSQIRFITTERPANGPIWSIWDKDVRHSPHLLGEMANRPSPFAKSPHGPPRRAPH